jgi:hypothetical protein
MLFANRFNPLALKILPLSPMAAVFCGDLSCNFFVFKIDRGRGIPQFQVSKFQAKHQFQSFEFQSFKKTPKPVSEFSRLQRFRGKSQAVATTG